jgi:5'-3' exonuclease
MYEDISTPDIEDASIKKQLIEIIRFLDCLPVTLISIDNIEADDTIAYLTTDIFKDSNVTIMSSDKDFYQLINERVKVYSPTKKKIYGPMEIHSEYNISSKNFIYFRIMDGDVSDNIDGVKGAGLKTILKAFPFLKDEVTSSVNDIIQHSQNNINSLKIYETVLKSKDILERNFKLMQLGDVDISGTTKLKIDDIVNTNKYHLNKIEFSKRLTESKMHTSFGNYNVWLIETFTILENYYKTK